MLMCSSGQVLVSVVCGDEVLSLSQIRQSRGSLQRSSFYPHSGFSAAIVLFSTLWVLCSDRPFIHTLGSLQWTSFYPHSGFSAVKFLLSTLWDLCSDRPFIHTLGSLQRSSFYPHSGFSAAIFLLSTLWVLCSNLPFIHTLGSLQRSSFYPHSGFSFRSRWSRAGESQGFFRIALTWPRSTWTASTSAYTWQMRQRKRRSSEYQKHQCLTETRHLNTYSASFTLL